MKIRSFWIKFWYVASAPALLLGMEIQEHHVTAKTTTDTIVQTCQNKALLHPSHPDVQALRQMKLNAKLRNDNELDACLTQKEFLWKLVDLETQTGYFFKTGYCLLPADKLTLESLQNKYRVELAPYVKLQQEYKDYLETRQPSTELVNRSSTWLEQMFSVTTQLSPPPATSLDC